MYQSHSSTFYLMDLKAYSFLFLFFIANSFATSAQTRATEIAIPFQFNITEYGAEPGRQHNVTEAIQQTIDACAAQGGGKVYVPAGEFYTATIELKSNIELHLATGAVLHAIPDTSLYRNNKKGLENTGEGFTPALLLADGAENIAITGFGKIVGEPTFGWTDITWNDEFPGWLQNAREAGVEMKAVKVLAPKISLVYLTDCKNVTIKDISLINSPNWSCHIQWSSDVKITGIKILSSLTHGVNSDGLDIDGCKRVTVSDCTIMTGDDAICLKTTRQGGRSEACEDITINNCITSSTSCALKLGTESYADFNRIIFSDCIIRDSNRGLGIFIRDGGQVNDITFENIILECNRKPFFWWGDGDAFQFVVLKRNPDSKIGSIRNLKIRNISGKVQGTSLIRGFEQPNISDVELSNIQLVVQAELEPDKRATYGMIAEQVENLKMNDIDIRFNTTATEQKWKSALLLKDVHQLILSHFTGKLAAVNKQMPLVEMQQVTDATIQQAVAQPGTGTFFSINGEKTANIHFLANDMLQAKQPLSVAPALKDEVYWEGKKISRKYLRKYKK